MWHFREISPKKARFVDDTDSVMSNVFPEKRKNSETLFNRYPRKRLAFGDKTIEIDSPPMPMGKDGIPLIMRMGSSMIMGSTAALTGNVTMLASSILLPLLSQGYTKEQKEEYEERRLEKYREYLSQKQEEILQEKEREESVLRQNYPELSKVLGYVYEKKKLWSRTNSDDDFLDVRIGSGNIPLKAKISCPGEHFDMEEDVLKDELNELTETQVMLEQVPIMIPLLENRAIGIQGSLKDVTGFINTLVLQLAILFSYDEVKLVFLMEESQLDDMAYIKYLPHVWDDQRSIRLIATNASEAYQVGEYLLKELEKDLESQRKWEQIRSERPYYLVIALSKKLLDGVEVIKQVIQKKESIGLSLITGFPDVPKECSVILELNKETEEGIQNKLIYVRELDKEDETFFVDDFEEKEALESMRVLANTRLRLVSQAYALPKTVTFLEMFGVGRIEDLNIAERWKNHDPVTSLTNELYAIFMCHLLAGSETSLKYTELLLEDVKNAPKGDGLHVLWMHIMPFLQQPVKETFNYSKTMHISACDFVADGFREMQAADPYEAMAEKMVHCIYNGSVKERIQMAEKLAKQTDADGGILFAHWGCKGTIGASGLIKNVLETAGLPTMILDGDGCNPANTSDGQVSTRLQAFAEMLEKNKEEKHS